MDMGVKIKSSIMRMQDHGHADLEPAVICLFADRSTGWYHNFDISGNCGVRRMMVAIGRACTRDTAHRVHRNPVFGNDKWHPLPSAVPAGRYCRIFS